MPKIKTVEQKQSNYRNLFSFNDDKNDKQEVNLGNPLRLYDNLKLQYPQSSILELLRAQAELKVLKSENQDLLSRIESNNVELIMLRNSIDMFKAYAEDSGKRSKVLEKALNECKEEFALTK